ncbi:MAG: binding-protein-dependent transport system inner rane component [Chloroflexi bacterium]|nr:binding-protein-dependent transport system inner rane component [Chloroflexota bacterium]
MATLSTPSPLRHTPGRRWRKARSAIGGILFYALVGMLVFALLAPFVWMIISSISPPTELASKPIHWIPEHPTLDRYRALFFGARPGEIVPIAVSKFINAMKSSLIIATATTLVCIITGTAAAYALIRLPVPKKEGFLFGMLAAQMMPIIVIIIPLYLMMQRLVLNDTWQGMILLYSGFMLPTVIWIMYGYFQTLPEELEEAAMIDGCSRVGALLRVVLPISGPGLVAISAFAFLYTWNEFFMALIFTASRTKTIPVIVTEFSTQAGIDYGLMTTAGVIGSLPPLILAFLLQRYIVAGLTSGAVKG